MTIQKVSLSTTKVNIIGPFKTTYSLKKDSIIFNFKKMGRYSLGQQCSHRERSLRIPKIKTSKSYTCVQALQ